MERHRGDEAISATKWKDVSASERAECQKISDADKERYYEEMRNYVPLPDEKEEEPAPRYDKDGNRKRRKRIKTRRAKTEARTSSGRKSTAKSTFDRRLRRRKLFLSATKRRNSATRGRR